MDEADSQDPMAEATETREAQMRDCLRPDEIGPAFDGLSQDDKLKLHAIEAIRRRGNAFGKGELLREALCRALDGSRKCPRGVPLVAFLAMTMKSIASHALEKDAQLVAMADPPETEESGRPESSLAQSPEGEAMAASVLQDIYAHFETDEKATLVLMGWADGYSGKTLREATGLQQAEIDYAVKRIRSAARALYPEGWET